LVTAKRVELKRSAEATGFHEAYFKGPITNVGGDDPLAVEGSAPTI
jgi:hypothetical protein